MLQGESICHKWVPYDTQEEMFSALERGEVDCKQAKQTNT